MGGWAQSRKSLDEARALLIDPEDRDLAAGLRASELELGFQTGELTAADIVRSSSNALARIDDQSSVYAVRLKATLGWAYASTGRYVLSERLIEQVVASKLLTVDHRKLLPSLWLDGPWPVPEAVRLCEELLASKPSPRTAGSCYRTLALLRSMQGEFAVAHSLCDEDHRILEELGLSVLRAASNGIRATIYSDAGKPLNAERELRAGIKKLRNLGEALYSTGLEVQLARVLLEEGKGPRPSEFLGQMTLHRVRTLDISWTDSAFAQGFWHWGAHEQAIGLGSGAAQLGRSDRLARLSGGRQGGSGTRSANEWRAGSVQPTLDGSRATLRSQEQLARR